MGHWSLHISDETTRWSDEIYPILERTPSEGPVGGSDFIQRYVHPDDRTMVTDIYAASIHSRSMTESKFRIITETGRLLWVYLSYKTRFDAGGSPVELFGTIQDVTKAQMTQDPLRRSESALKEAQQLAGIGSWHYDFTADRLEWSDQIYRILELDPTPPSYERFTAVLHPDDHALVNATFIDAIKGKKPYAIEHRLQMPDGRIKHVLQRGRTVHDPMGIALSANGTLQDITERKMLENTILAERNFITAMVDAANAIICVVRPDGTMSRINRYGAEFTGYSREEIASAPYFWIRFVPEEIRTRMKKAFERLQHGEVVQSYQNCWISKSGETRMFEWSNQLIYRDDGSMDYLLSIGIDISERAEVRQLMHQKEELQTIFNSVTDGLAILDLDSNFIKFNDAYIEITGYPRDELLQQSCIGLSPPEDAARAGDVIREVLLKGRKTNFEKSCIRKDGSIVTVNMSVALMPDRSHLLVSSRDTTQDRIARKEREDLLQEQTSLLSLFDKGDAVLFKWHNNPSRRVAYASRNVDRFLGYAPREFMEDAIHYASCIHFQDLERFEQEMQSIVTKKSDFFRHAPYRILRRSGDVR